MDQNVLFSVSSILNNPSQTHTVASLAARLQVVRRHCGGCLVYDKGQLFWT